MPSREGLYQQRPGLAQGASWPPEGPVGRPERGLLSVPVLGMSSRELSSTEPAKGVGESRIGRVFLRLHPAALREIIPTRPLLGLSFL